MFASEHSEVLRETEQLQEHPSNPAVDAVPPERGSDRQTPFWNPVGTSDADENTFETFVDGAGI